MEFEEQPKQFRTTVTKSRQEEDSMKRNQYLGQMMEQLLELLAKAKTDEGRDALIKAFDLTVNHR